MGRGARSTGNGSARAAPAEVAAAIAVAAGRAAGDLLLTNCRVVNVFTNELVTADVLVAGRLIAAVGAGLADGDVTAAETVDLSGALVAPGLIDGHVHLESALVAPAAYAEALVPRGVTAVVCDPHEVANVAGVAGVRWLLEATEGLPFDVWVAVPSCVPSSKLETTGAEFGLAEMAALMGHPRVVGVAEIMSFPDVVAGEPEVLAKAALAEERDLIADGHAPGVTGRALQAYLASGIASDHEVTTLAAGLERLRAGAYLMVREGSVARDLSALMPLVDPRHGDRIGFVTDDKLPHDLLAEGGVDHLVRTVASVADAADTAAYAVRCASYNNARHFRLRRRGAVAPGYFADLVVVDDLAGFTAGRVYKDGSLVALAGEPVQRNGRLFAAEEAAVRRTVRLPTGLGAGSFRVKAPTGATAARCVVAVPNQIVTRTAKLEPPVVNGWALADPRSDLAKLACVERHGRSGGVATCFVSGFGLKRGAIASSVGHDHHNLLVVGVDDGDMHAACARLAELGGGFVAVQNGEVLAELPLPLAGLVTEAPLTEVATALTALDEAARGLGITLPSPFMALSFLGLPVIPELKLTDLGLVDVDAGELVSLWT